MLERRAALGLRGMRLKLLILARKPFGIGDAGLLASRRVVHPVRECRRRKYRHAARAGKTDFNDLHVVVDRSAFLRRPVLVLDRVMLEQRDYCFIGIFWHFQFSV